MIRPALRGAGRRFGLAALALPLVILLTAPAGADEDGPDDAADLLFSCSDGEARITGYSGSGGAVAIPAEIDDPDHGTCQVVAIGGYAFDGLGATDHAITSVTIPDTVTVVGDRAFRDAGLTELTFAEGSQLEIIDVGAFAHNQLSTLAVPGPVTQILSYAFTGNQIEELTFGSDSALTFIGTEAFDAAYLTEIAFPATLETIGANAFRRNPFQSVTFLGPVPTINATAFATPHRDGADFLGWHADQYYINRLDGFPSRLTVARTLYARWSDTSMPDLVASCTDGEATIEHYRGTATHVVIPEQIDGCTVTSLGGGPSCTAAPSPAWSSRAP